MKIGVSIGMTLCTNPDRREFLRLGLDVTDIDTDGDVEAQAETCIAAGVKVFAKLDEGLNAQVSDILMGAQEPGLSKDRLDEHSTAVDEMKELLQKHDRLIGGIVTKVTELIEKVEANNE